MNKAIPFLLFIFWSTLLYSQSVVVDGATFSADGKTLIKYPTDKFYKEYIIPEGTEIIDRKAFVGAKIGKVTLPTTLTHIKDSAFYNGPTDFILAGKFPIIGNRVWANDRRFEVTESNPYCRVSNDGFVYSKDGKTVHIAFGGIAGNMGYVEIIDRYAFQDCYFAYGIIYIPDNVHLIREHAFDNIKPTYPTRSESSYDFEFTCDALTPPELEGEVFTENNVGNSTLFVPKESEELYKTAFQWNTFGTIKGYTSGPPQGVFENSVSFLKVNRVDGAIYIEALKPLETVRLIDLNGNIVREKNQVNSCHTICDISSLDGFLGLLYVIYKDEDSEVVKLNF
ncbi:leucine-rich repeat domain-containing protein [Bacteroides salyersiae]|uniref:leucine-rich repeat protein n=1 Tax=Bacteroides salyersiae TaxID=291644 RepID=UPI001C37F9E6|nr:leucine-rich repeat protein [Bacteroides salyersiae]MBV4204240.1 leucine-rich repeat domain-containing protein [Bacteroides salyersiae]MCB6649637.1 leucine-rich repeat domain-containing protein [Bacteroides salyersiae]